MSIQKTMGKYAELNKALVQYQEVNKDVFQTAQEIEKSIKEVEEEIKAYARESKEDTEHDGVKVTVIRKFRKWYDWSILSPKNQKLLEKEGAVKHEVSKDVFEDLVHDQKITVEERADAFKEEELATSVSVKIIK